MVERTENMDDNENYLEVSEKNAIVEGLFLVHVESNLSFILPTTYFLSFMQLFLFLFLLVAAIKNEFFTV